MTSGSERRQADELQRGAIGVAGIVFFVVAAAGPLGSMLGAGPVAFIGDGAGAPGAYLLAGLLLLIFSVGFATMARYVASAGGFAVIISRGLGRRAGFAAAFVALLAYNGMMLGILGYLGFIGNIILADLFSLHVSWQVITAVAVALIAVLGYNNVAVSIKVLGVLMLCEVAILAIFDVVVLGGGGESGWTAEPFKPSVIFSGAPGIAFLFAFASFIGFEATTIFGEEARDPRRTVPRATYTAVLLIAGFYVLTMFAIAVAYGPDAVGEAAAADPGNLVFAASSRYLGGWATDIMQVLLLTSLFAAITAFHNYLSRYLFALGAGGLLPQPLGRSHPRHQAPHLASLVQTVFTAAVLVVFMIAGADPFFDLFAPMTGVGTVGVIALQAVASIAVIGFFWQNRVERNPWKTVVAPAIGAAGLITAAVLALNNFGELTETTTGVVPLLPWALVIAALAGVAIGTVRSRRGASLDRGFALAEEAEAGTVAAESAPI